MTHNGYARAISPVHTSLDGDTIFTLGTGEVEVNIDTLGTLSAYVMEKLYTELLHKLNLPMV